MRHPLALHLLAGLHRARALPPAALPLLLVPGALILRAAVIALLHQRGALGDAAGGSYVLIGRRLASRRLMIRVALGECRRRQRLEPEEVSVVVVVVVDPVVRVLSRAGGRGGLVERELGAEVGELQHVGEAELVERHRLLALRRRRCWCGRRRVHVVAKHVVDHRLGPAGVLLVLVFRRRREAVEVTALLLRTERKRAPFANKLRIIRMIRDVINL